jgi:hypothetical protein
VCEQARSGQRAACRGGTGKATVRGAHLAAPRGRRVWLRRGGAGLGGGPGPSIKSTAMDCPTWPGSAKNPPRHQGANIGTHPAYTFLIWAPAAGAHAGFGLRQSAPYRYIPIVIPTRYILYTTAHGTFNAWFYFFDILHTNHIFVWELFSRPFFHVRTIFTNNGTVGKYSHAAAYRRP